MTVWECTDKEAKWPRGRVMAVCQGAELTGSSREFSDGSGQPGSVPPWVDTSDHVSGAAAASTSRQAAQGREFVQTPWGLDPQTCPAGGDRTGKPGCAPLSSHCRRPRPEPVAEYYASPLGPRSSGRSRPPPREPRADLRALRLFQHHGQLPARPQRQPGPRGRIVVSETYVWWAVNGGRLGK